MEDNLKMVQFKAHAKHSINLYSIIHYQIIELSLISKLVFVFHYHISKLSNYHISKLVFVAHYHISKIIKLSH